MKIIWLNRLFETKRIKKVVLLLVLSGPLALLIDCFLATSSNSEGFFGNLSYDIPFHLRNDKTNGNKVIFISVDSGLKKEMYLSNCILDREYYATLVDGLTKVKAKAVFFDIDIQADGSPDGDKRFAEAIKNNGRVVIGRSLTSDGGTNRLNPPPDILKRALGNNFGHFVLQTDSDYFVRRLPGMIDDFPGVPPFSWVAANLITQIPANRLPQSSEKYFLNHYNKISSGLKAEHQNGLIDALRDTGSNDLFQDAIIVVGQGDAPKTIGEPSDQFRNPWRRVTGVQLHTTAILNFINGDYLRQVPVICQFVLTFVFGLIAAIICSSTTRTYGWIVLTFLSILVVIFSLLLPAMFGFWWHWTIPIFVTFPIGLVSAQAIGRPFKYDVFISYKRSKPDRPGGSGYAGIIYELLRRRGIKVFMDSKFGHDDFGNSNGWKDIAEHHIKHASRLVLIMSGRCFDECTDTEDPVAWEVNCAKKYGVSIIPVKFSDYQPPTISKPLLSSEKAHVFLSIIETHSRSPLSEDALGAIRKALASTDAVQLTEEIRKVLEQVPLDYPDRSEVAQKPFFDNLIKRIKTDAALNN
jgi:CHASE2 domain-containing sensor protein